MSSAPSGSVLRDKGGLISPVIRRIEHEGRPAILKDYRGKNVLARSILGPSIVRNEFEILRKLEGLPGIPRVYAVLDGAALVTEFIEGKPIHKYPPGDLPSTVFDELRELVIRMHERGVVHLDMRQKKNIMIRDDLRPHLIDFGGALAPRKDSPLHGLLPFLREIDGTALLKVKQRTFPALLTDEDEDRLRRHKFWRRFWIFTPRGKYVR